MKRIHKALAVAMMSASLISGAAFAQNKPVEIQMWMGLTGLAGETISKYGEEFNKMQSDYKVVVSFKGQYPEQRAAAVAAFRAGGLPARKAATAAARCSGYWPLNETTTL